jgi:DNA repair exonuclease SbcCD nuclease subunit
MKIQFVADIHIKLGQRKVPKEWQRNRYRMLVEEINNIDCDLLVIGGDTIDSSKPSLEELESYFEFIASIDHETIVYAGNHEQITKNLSVLDTFAEETTRCNPKVKVVGSYRSDDFDIIDFEELHKTWAKPQSKLLFTHVRAALPEHMKTDPEVDLSRFDVYDLVITGDLHDHKMSQETDKGTPIIYPGAPVTTSFHRELSETSNGIITIDTDTLKWEWHNLKHLPQLLRYKITDPKEMVEHKYHRVVYELEGDVLDLKKVQGSELLDKKINVNVSKEAKLNLKDKEIPEELHMFLTVIEGLSEDKVRRCMKRFGNAITLEEV